MVVLSMILISTQQHRPGACACKKPKGLLKGGTTKCKIFGQKVKKASLRRFVRLVKILKQKHEEFNRDNGQTSSRLNNCKRRKSKRGYSQESDSDSSEYAYRYGNSRRNRRMRKEFEKFEKRENEGKWNDWDCEDDDEHYMDRPRMQYYNDGKGRRNDVVVYRTRDVDWNGWLRKISFGFDKIQNSFKDISFDDEDEQGNAKGRGKSGNRYSSYFKPFDGDSWDFDKKFKRKPNGFSWRL